MNARDIKIGILDDHKLFRSGICELIKDEEGFDVLISADTRQELLSKLKKIEIDILLLDIRLKDDRGDDVLVEVKKLYPSTKVVMLTMHSENSFLIKMVKHGADGYLVKDSEPEELIKTLKNVYTYGKHFSSLTTGKIIKGMQKEELKIKNGEYLKPYEIKVIKYLSEGKTAEEIGLIMHKSPRTVEGYKQKLLEKTKTKNTAELISWGYKDGCL